MNCRSIPKVELHAHLSGSISEETILELISEKKASLPSEIIEDMKSSLELKENRSLVECFKIFSLLHMLTDRINNVKKCTYDVIREFSEDNVWYLELRTTPKNVDGSYTKEDYIEAILETVRKAEKSFGIIVRILISLDRSRGVEDAWDTLKIIEKLRNNFTYKKYICGIDISGNPNKDSLIEYLSVLRESRKLGLKLAVHLLEVAEPIAIEEAAAVFSEGLVDRIGHGTFLHHCSGKTEDLVNHVLEHKIPIEMCITSNIKSGTVKDLESHHVKWWKEKGHPIAICTDDKGVFSTTLSDELSLYCMAVNSNIQEQFIVVLNALEASFLGNGEKEELRLRISNYLEKYVKQ